MTNKEFAVQMMNNELVEMTTKQHDFYETILNGMNKLTGSEKQIKWANGLRRDWIIKLAADLPETAEIPDAQMKATIDLFNNATTAKFWIDIEMNGEILIVPQLAKALRNAK